MTQTTFDLHHKHRTQTSLTAGFVQMFTASAEQVSAWRQRSRQRRDLKAATPRLLDDMGITEAQRQQEVSKPFWKA